MAGCAAGLNACSLFLTALALSVTAFTSVSVAQGKPQVQLLFPVESGTELDRLSSLAPEAKITNLQGRSYILVGEYADARVAYRLGKSLQRRFRIAFELAYDPGHPQSNFAWLRELESKPAQPRKSGPIARAERARVAARARTPIARTPLAPTVIARAPSAATVARNRLSQSSRDLLALSNPMPQPLSSAPGANRSVSSPAAPPMLSSDREMAGRQDFSDSSISLKLQARTAAETKPNNYPLSPVVTTVITLPPRAGQADGVASAAPPQTVSQLVGLDLLQKISSNATLIYLYAELADRAEVERFSRLMDVASEYQDGRGRWILQVGVYQRSLTGRQLLEADLEKLKMYGVASMVYDRTALMAVSPLI